MKRPDPARWVWYAFGGKLPAQYREWVLHDVTTPTWWLRHVLRSLVQLSPVAIILVLVLGANWITYVALLAGLILGLIYSVAYIEETAEHRLAKHGFPLGMAKEMRRARVETAALDDERRRHRFGGF